MYPKKVALFVPWSKAMVQGATVGQPQYGGKSATRGKRTGSKTYKTRPRRNRRTHAKKAKEA